VRHDEAVTTGDEAVEGLPSHPVFAAEALRPAILGVLAVVVFARVTWTLLLNAFNAPDEMFIVYFYGVVFGGLWWTCLVVSGRYGSGRPFHDFGMRWVPRDIWRGAGVFLLARIAQVITLAPFVGHLDRLRRLTEGLERVSMTSFLLFAFTAVVVAPVFEELVFRGMLQRSLTAQWSNGWAIAVQGALFGLYHVTPGLGATNVPYALSLMAAGWAFGWAASRWRRLGPGSTAHFFMNAIGTAALYGAR